ncbi:MAG: SagB/ThcOx family dehydrogenase [Promethearchaeia archaeon]
MKKEKYGYTFQQKSKYTRDNLPRHQLDWVNKPDTYKQYPDASKKIELPPPKYQNNTDFWQVIIHRHSVRNFSQDPITLMELSVLLFGMSGVTRRSQHSDYRTVPSAGALYPIETYPVINNVENTENGIYHYNILEHSLEFLEQGDFRKQMANGCLGQQIAYKSAVNFIWTAVISRSRWKYLQRCYRYIYLDCGHIGQNFYLVAEGLDLGACTIGAIFDDELNKLLKIDGEEETAIYVGVVGKKVKKS